MYVLMQIEAFGGIWRIFLGGNRGFRNKVKCTSPASRCHHTHVPYGRETLRERKAREQTDVSIFPCQFPLDCSTRNRGGGSERGDDFDGKTSMNCEYN